MLFWKFEMGLFDDPYVDPDEAERVVGCDEHRELALTAAQEAITLLKNENDLAPLDLEQDQDPSPSSAQRPPQPAGRLQRRAQAQCHGARRHQGEGRQEDQGPLQRRLQDHHRRLVEPGRSGGERSRRGSQADCRSRRSRASKADVIVLAIGGNEQTSREAWGLQPHGRPHQPRSDRPPGRAGESDGRAGQAGHRLPVQRPAALDQLPQPRMCR